MTQPSDEVKAPGRVWIISQASGDFRPKHWTNRPPAVLDDEKAFEFVRADLAPPVSPDAAHYLPNWLWCERCQAWVETNHHASTPSVADAIKVVEGLQDEWVDADADFVWIEAANQIIARLQSLTGENK